MSRLVYLQYTDKWSTLVFLQKFSPRFMGDNFEKNKTIYFRLDALAKKHGCTPAQLAIAWVLHRGDDIAPIPGK